MFFFGNAAFFLRFFGTISFTRYIDFDETVFFYGPRDDSKHIGINGMDSDQWGEKIPLFYMGSKVCSRI